MASEPLETLLAERELLDLLALFDDYAIRTDLKAFADLWTENAEWTIGEPIPMKAQGRDAIVQALATLQQQNLFFFRMTARPIFQIKGNQAKLRSTTIELAGRSGNKAYANAAFYNDQAERGSDGKWRFKRRDYVYLWVDTDATLGGRSVALPADLA